MAKVSAFNMALRGAAVAGLLFVSVAPSQAAGLWSQRFQSLRGNTVKTTTYSSSTGFTWPAIIQYRAYNYDQRLSRFFGRSVSPFCRIFC
ncbi:hypothetical protein ACI7BZ_17450 [Xanthobacter sp. AM11]|uniref:hypothetical protein n=1 Tax=Xanthobacter sp. AM11 TaxID=3380643 RepID=UPI0039BF6F81